MYQDVQSRIVSWETVSKSTCASAHSSGFGKIAGQAD